MMPDLGPYALPVLASYAATAILIGILVTVSLRRARQTREALRELEKRTGRDHV